MSHAVLPESTVAAAAVDSAASDPAVSTMRAAAANSLNSLNFMLDFI
jgi:hypothetical protein